MDGKVIVVGAGLAGLSAGCYAQMNGYQSRIFEHAAQPGGVAVCWQRGEYLIEGGIHFLMSHRPGTATYDMYREVGATEGTRFLDAQLSARFQDEASGRVLDITSDLDRLARDLKDISPADGAEIDALIAGARAMQGSDLGALMQKPYELMGALDKLRMVAGVGRSVRYYSGKYAEPMSDYSRRMHDPWLQQVLNNLFLPTVPVWFVMGLLALVGDRRIGLIEGGSRSFVGAIADRYAALGGEIIYEATVERILVEGDRAVGVQLADGTEHRAGAVISAADGHSTLFGMLQGRYLDAGTRARYETWSLISPMLIASFGVAREFAGEPWETFLYLKEPLTVCDRPVREIGLRILNYSREFAPSGKSVIQVGFDTEWECWESLQRDRQRYEAEKQRVADDIMRRLEGLYPDITAQVEVTDVATPYTTWRYTLNRHGAYMGWLPTHQNLMTQIPRTLPGLSGFYMAGQWALPGGGVPTCLFTGRQAVQLMCHHDRRRFRGR